jgi:hypothetical protein
LTGGIRKGAKGEPPVAYFHSYRSLLTSLCKGPANFSSLTQNEAPLIFFFSSTDFLGYDTILEEIYLSG